MEELLITGLLTKETFSVEELSSDIFFGRDSKKLSSFTIPSFIFSEMPSSTADAIFPSKASTSLKQI